MQVLGRYAKMKKQHQLRCSASFFMGLLKQVADKKPAVLVVPKSVPTVSATVSPEAKHKLAELYAQGILEPALMDQHCSRQLAALPHVAQLTAITRIAANIGAAEDKHGYLTQLLKHMLINASEVHLKLSPETVFYDAELAMCWRVFTKQDKWDCRSRLAKGKQIKLAKLSKPRQLLAQQLHPDHPQYHAATAAAWKNTDVAVKETLLRSADLTGEAIKLLPDEPKVPIAAEPEFHETDFPPLGLAAQTQQHAPDLHLPASSGKSSLRDSAVLSKAAGWSSD